MIYLRTMNELMMACLAEPISHDTKHWIRLAKTNPGVGIEVKKVIFEKEYDGYVVRKEIWTHGGMEDTETEIEAAYTPSGDYIGDKKKAKSLVEDKGIAPEKSSKDHCVCSIGFCEDEEKWYGWSHRAIHGFGVGDEVEFGDVTAGELSVGFKAKTLADAKKMAKAFAEGVS